MTNYYDKDTFGNMDDIFNQLMGNWVAIAVKIDAI